MSIFWNALTAAYDWWNHSPLPPPVTFTQDSDSWVKIDLCTRSTPDIVASFVDLIPTQLHHSVELSERKTLTTCEIFSIESQLSCPDSDQFFAFINKRFPKLTLCESLGSGVTSKVWKVTFQNLEGLMETKALRVSRTDSLPDQVKTNYYAWNSKRMGGEWNALLDYQSEHILSTDLAIAWNDQSRTFEILTQRQVMEMFRDSSLLRGATFTLYATFSHYVEGVENLQDRIDQSPSFEVSTIRHFAKQIFEGLAALHRLDPDLMHRDIKPANILVTKENHLLLCDFGFSKIGSLEGTSVGSPAYMAPELLLMKHYNGQADIYSTFVILFRLATGEAPVPAKSPWELSQRLAKRIKQNCEFDKDPRLATIAPLLRDLILQTGKLSPEERLTAEDALRHPFFTEQVV